MRTRSFVPARRFYAGIDLGGTKIRALVAGENGAVLGDERTATLAEDGPDAVIERIVQAARAAAAQARIEFRELRAVGVSAPGPIDTRAGVITAPPNLPGWHDVPLASILRERLGVAVLLENDANCSGLGEHQFGAGRGCRHMIYITVSTGIGAGIIIDNELYAGASGAAGEVGHMAVAAEGPMCGAAHTGCLEAFASGTGIAAQARRLIAAGHLPRTAALAGQEPPLSARTVHEAAKAGETQAREIIGDAARYLGIGLGSLLNIFNPQAIVLGGGVIVNMSDLMLGPAIEAARARAFEQAFADARIVLGELGDRSAALGALALVRSRDAAAAI